jgi:hypothetical protein
LLDEDSGSVEESLGESAGGVFEEIFGGQDLEGIRNVLTFFGGTICGDDDFGKGFLGGDREGEQKKRDFHKPAVRERSNHELVRKKPAMAVYRAGFQRVGF